MSLVTEVVADLWQFTKSEFSGYKKAEILPAATVSTNEPKHHSDDWEEFKALSTNKTAYIKHSDTPFTQRPMYAFDVRLESLSYGTEVIVIQEKGEWIQVLLGKKQGWVEADNLSLLPTAVLPIFISQMQYTNADRETKKLRFYIADEFSAELAGLPLLNTEYVWYRLQKEHRTFTWPDVRPRTPGRWAKLLASESTVLVSSVPLTGSVMEYRESSIAELMYVEAVEFDESIRLSGFSGDDTGTFLQKFLTATEWKSKGAKFICPI